MRITAVRVTPVAVPDLPLVNCKGVHQAVFLRSIIEVETDTGLTGLGESYGARRTLAGLTRTAAHLEGLDPFDLNDLDRRVRAALPEGGGINAPTAVTDHQLVDVVYAAFEVACLDLQAKSFGIPMYRLLGGKVRDRVGFSAYLFFKFAARDPASAADPWGEVMTPDALVAEARELVAQNGFRSLKLKGGVLEPAAEMETIRKLRETFPHHPIRIDPMGAWTVPTAIAFAKESRGLLEYLEDPVIGLDAMAEVAAKGGVPLATNLWVIEFGHLPRATATNAVQVILADHHYWRGLRGAQTLERICAAWGLGTSMHSNSHLGITLAAMTHLAATSPNLTYDSDTHSPWTDVDVIKGGALKFVDGSLPVPDGPGLGVEIDPDMLARLHANYLAANVMDRDDTAEMRRYVPDYVRKVPRW